MYVQNSLKGESIYQCCVWFGICLALSHTIIDGDIWWHIAVGKYTIQNGCLPKGDEWSFTAPGISYVYNSWLSDCLFYWIWHYTGDKGLNVINVSANIMTCALVFLYTRKKTDCYFSLVLTCLMAYWLSFCSLRPQIFTPFFTVLLLMLIDESKKYATINFVFIILLFFVWVNLHGGFSIGLIVLISYAAGYILFYSLTGLGGESARYFVLLSIFSLLITLINPYGFDIYESIIQGVQNQSFDWDNISFNPRNVSMPTALSVVICALFLSWYVMYVVNEKKVYELPSLVLCLSTYLFLLTARRLEWLLLIPLALLFQNYNSIKQEIFPINLTNIKYLSINKVRSFKVAFLYGILIIIFIPFAYNQAFYAKKNWHESFSKEMVEYISSNELSGNIFCPLTWSGKITLVGNGRLKTYIDGRLLLYPANFFKDYLDILYHRGFTASQIDAFGIDYLLLPDEFTDEFIVSSSPILWEPIKVSDDTILFKRKASTVKLTNGLLNN